MTYSLKIINHLKLIHLINHISLHFKINIVNNNQKHINQNKKYEKNKQHKKNKSQIPINNLQLIKIKISQNNTKQYKTKKKINKFLYIYNTKIKIFKKKIKNHNYLTKNYRNY